MATGTPSAIRTLSGMMVDASCRDRTSLNLHQVPVVEPKAQAETAQTTEKNTGAVSAKGVSVTAETADPERLNAIAQLTPDALARQQDMSCAVTAGTSNYAVLLDDGRLLNLNQGGNTLAAQAMQSFEAGRAMMNGTGPALKPKVKLRGRLRGDEILVEKVESLQ